MGGVVRFVSHVLREMIPPAVYFAVAFNIIVLTDAMAGGHPDGWTVAGAIVFALVAAKVVLIADALPFMKPARHAPILYTAAWKAAVYWVGALAVQMLERAVRSRISHGGLEPALDEVREPRFWAAQIWLFVLLLAYCVFQELARVIGRERAREILLGPRRERHRDGPP